MASTREKRKIILKQNKNPIYPSNKSVADKKLRSKFQHLLRDRRNGMSDK